MAFEDAFPGRPHILAGEAIPHLPSAAPRLRLHTTMEPRQLIQLHPVRSRKGMAMTPPVRRLTGRRLACRAHTGSPHQRESAPCRVWRQAVLASRWRGYVVPCLGGG